VGFVRQDSGLLPALTFEQNCRLVRAKAGKKWDDSLWHRLTTQLGLAGFGARLPHAMSHGQRQRGAMVRALIGQPHYVLADEPTSALDDANAKAMGELLLNLANEHKATLLIATHDKRLYDYFPQSYNVAAWHPPLLQGGAAA
jgi:putative ABC transport system ATP-binding protein